MENFGMAAAAPDLVVVCVQSREPFTGKLYHRYIREPLPFFSLYQVMEQIDKLCDDIGYPIRGMNPRSFQKENITVRKNYREAEQVMSFSELAEKAGDKGTFMVHVQFRQNATWQGQVTWVEKKQTQQFRSALELMKLIDGALNSEDDESK